MKKLHYTQAQVQDILEAALITDGHPKGIVVQIARLAEDLLAFHLQYGTKRR
jgi:hypothetical protein